MSEALKKFQQHSKKLEKGKEAPLSREDRRSLSLIRKEAKKAGTHLLHGGKGGLPPSLVLGVMRRDKYQCKSCGSRDNIEVHHKGGIVESKWLSKKGHANEKDNIVTICDKCHNRIHEKAKAEGKDSSQVTPEGDKGTDRDKGLPDAKE